MRGWRSEVRGEVGVGSMMGEWGGGMGEEGGGRRA